MDRAMEVTKVREAKAMDRAMEVTKVREAKAMDRAMEMAKVRDKAMDRAMEVARDKAPAPIPGPKMISHPRGHHPLYRLFRLGFLALNLKQPGDRRGLISIQARYRRMAGQFPLKGPPSGLTTVLSPFLSG